MTIIDGVDVSDCDWFYSGDCACDILDYSMCIDNSACYFKQLQRKEQECKRYKQALEKIKKNYEQHILDFEQWKVIMPTLKIINETEKE